jgi:dihydrofolate synthase / folylpolyglutamate synthase
MGGMNLDAGIAWLEDHIDYGSWAARSGRVGDVELSLDRMRRLVAELGEPQASLSVIHVTGTNGKGSTSRMITRLLMAEGLRVGTYSSPHLAAYNERFRVDDIDIDDATLAALLTRIRGVEHTMDDRLMPFEILTAAAYVLFAERDVDAAIVEVGVLGRYDATNVADGRVAVITNIGFDHTSGEGDWQMRIATEKAGIIKPGAHLVLGPVDDRFVDGFRAENPGAIWRWGEEVSVTADVATKRGRRLSVVTPWQRLDDLELPLHGAHQAVNCALAITAASAFAGRALTPDRVARGLAAVCMPARLESISVTRDARPTVILDGAHNPDAARALATALAEIPRHGRRVLVVGVLNGRDPLAMLDAMDAGSFDDIIASTPPTGRARPASEMAAAARSRGWRTTVIDDVGDALDSIIAVAGHDDQIVVTGSIYLVAEARRWLLHDSGRPDSSEA